jgi:hypothetical protein
MPSQSAREIANAIVGERWMDSFDKATARTLIVQAPHAAEQRGMEKAAGIAMDDAKFREGSLQEEAALRIAAAIRKAKEGL